MIGITENTLMDLVDEYTNTTFPSGKYSGKPYSGKSYFHTISIHSLKWVGVKLTNVQKASYQLTPYLEEVIVGYTLGDLTIERWRQSLTANSKLRFE